MSASIQFGDWLRKGRGSLVLLWTGGGGDIT